MSAKAILESARLLIKDESRWCADAYARNERGERVEPRSPDAVRWCAVGAIGVASKFMSDYLSAQDARDELRRAAHDLGYASEVELNDCGTGHAGVLEMFDRAIGQLS